MWKDNTSIALGRKAFGVLRYLVENPGRLVTKDELLDAVWPETHVGEGVLKVSVAEIRKALSDTSSAPRFIETAHRRGYRFVGEIERDGLPAVAATVRAIERERDLARLQSWMERALAGERQVVFITGETGIGKTTLVETFVERLRPDSAVWIAHGQCLEHFGEGEPYFPVLGALARLCRQPGRERFVELLRRHAPAWLAQMPSLVSDSNREALKREVLGAAKDRMLREIGEAIEALTAETPLVLVLEDLHWSDYSTVDLIGYLARGREPARLLVLGTYRPVEAIVKQHPLRALKRELQIHRRSAELAVEFLSPEAVGRYLALRFPHSEFPGELAALIHQRTDGNPLFLVNVVDFLIASGQIVRAGSAWKLALPLADIGLGIPDSLQQLIEKQMERLSPDDRRILSVASVAGMEFSTRTLGGGLAGELPDLESVCEDLVRRGQFLRPAKMIQLNDGSLLERYGFTHVLYQHVLYHAVPEPRRVLLHRRIGEFQERAFADHLEEISAELAVHFEQGRDFARAIRYLRLSARTSASRSANREALDQLGRAMLLVGRLPVGGRDELEAEILEERGMLFRALDDHSGAIGAYERLIDLARASRRLDWEVRALLKLSAVLFWTDHDRSLEVAARAVELSRGIEPPELHVHARGYYASRSIRLTGWDDGHFRDVVAAVEAARASRDTGYLGLHLMSYSFFLTYRSEEWQAWDVAAEGLRISLDTGDAFLYISCLYFQAWALLHLGEWGRALEVLHQGIDLSVKNGNATAETVLNMVLARLHAHAFDFAGAKEICERALPTARAGFPRLIALTMLGEAHLGLGDLPAARECLLRVVQETEAGPYCLDWVFRMPFRQTRAELYLTRGCLGDAAREAQMLLGLASQSGQKTYVALAHLLLARIAQAQGDLARAHAAIGQARKSIESGAAPLAEWRVLATASEIARARDEGEEADSLAAASAEAVQRLAASLPETHPLRASLAGRAPGYSRAARRP